MVKELQILLNRQFKMQEICKYKIIIQEIQNL